MHTFPAKEKYIYIDCIQTLHNTVFFFLSATHKRQSPNSPWRLVMRYLLSVCSILYILKFDLFMTYVKYTILSFQKPSYKEFQLFGSKLWRAQYKAYWVIQNEADHLVEVEIYHRVVDGRQYISHQYEWWNTWQHMVDELTIYNL